MTPSHGITMLTSHGTRTVPNHHAKMMHSHGMQATSIMRITTHGTTTHGNMTSIGITMISIGISKKIHHCYACVMNVSKKAKIVMSQQKSCTPDLEAGLVNLMDTIMLDAMVYGWTVDPKIHAILSAGIVTTQRSSRIDFSDLEHLVAAVLSPEINDLDEHSAVNNMISLMVVPRRSEGELHLLLHVDHGLHPSNMRSSVSPLLRPRLQPTAVAAVVHRLFPWDQWTFIHPATGMIQRSLRPCRTYGLTAQSRIALQYRMSITS